MSIRYRYGQYYIRKVVKDEDGVRHWLERGPYRTEEAAKRASRHISILYRPKADPILTDLVVSRIFDRFKNTPYYHILLLGYNYGVPLKAAYEVAGDDLEGSMIKISGKIIELDLEASRALHERVSKLLTIQLAMKHKIYDKLYLAVSDKTGKRLSLYSMNYVTKVIRMEICPNWTYEKFRKIYTLHNEG